MKATPTGTPGISLLETQADIVHRCLGDLLGVRPLALLHQAAATRARMALTPDRLAAVATDPLAARELRTAYAEQMISAVKTLLAGVAAERVAALRRELLAAVVPAG